MKKIVITAAMLAASAGHAPAGEAEPVAVEEQAGTSSGGLLVPALLLIATAAAVASSDSSTPSRGKD